MTVFFNFGKIICMEKEIIKSKAYLICPYTTMDNAEYRAKELELLCESAFYEIVKCNLFHAKELNAKTYFGQGRVEEIKKDIAVLGADIAILDCPLTGSQLRNLTDLLEVKVIDRTSVILDIFASRAKSSEGKLQVELARLKYSLPRLLVENTASERTGMRGASESKAEINRRKIKEDIARIEKEVQLIQKHRQTTRKQRLSRMKSVALVGYTNAGKSTLMNSLAKAGTYADNRLFATLDVLTKKIWDDGVEYVLIDTVGFVSNLPHDLMYAFSATLEETLDSNVLLMVVDASDINKYDQIKVVEKEFDRLNIPKDKIILVYNKSDKIPQDEINQLETFGYDTCYISAKSGDNLRELKDIIKTKLR